MTKTPCRVTTLREVKADADWRAGQFRDNCAWPLIGKIEHHIVALLAQRTNQLPLHLELVAGALFFPAPINGENLIDIRIGGEHIPGFFIQQDINAGRGILLFEGVNERRDQQHIAMMAQLNNQDSRRGHRAGRAGFRRHSLFFIQYQVSDSRGSD
ncbi:Uncharacterised protein [Raoultella ornithinolytica]|nr:Uncharacterised protein [Raoultella ornithinolytica]